jgi:hypothetical protein
VEQDAKESQLQSPQSLPRAPPLANKPKLPRQDNGTQKNHVQKWTALENKALDNPLHRSALSGALLAAAAAAHNSKSRSKTPPPLPTLEKAFEGAKLQKCQEPIPQTSESTNSPWVAAAKACVQRSNSSSSFDDSTKTLKKLGPQRFPSDPPLFLSAAPSGIPGGSNSGISVSAMDNKSHWATKAAKLSSTVSAQDEFLRFHTAQNQEPDVPGQAARSIAKKRHAAVPVAEVDKEAKFGVILTRSVSPAPFHRGRSSGHLPLRKNVQSIYQLPELAASEPGLPSRRLEPFRRPTKVHTTSLPIPLASHPKLSDRDSSERSSLADFGAATAMTSRSSSAVSLPVSVTTNVENPEFSSQGTYTNRRRHVHLKTTMRKESRPERERYHSHPGPQAMTARERKRYEGVWASNHSSNLPISSDYIDNFVVREIWSRSQLPAEMLGHIW